MSKHDKKIEDEGHLKLLEVVEDPTYQGSLNDYRKIFDFAPVSEQEALVIGACEKTRKDSIH